MNRIGSVLLYLLLGLGLGCGKYGPPVRAGAEPPPARRQGFEVPLPVVPEQSPPETTPTVPEVEEEPPLEGAP